MGKLKIEVQMQPEGSAFCVAEANGDHVMTLGAAGGPSHEANRRHANKVLKVLNARKLLRDAVEHVLLVSEDGEMDDLDFIMLRDALKKSK